MRNADAYFRIADRVRDDAEPAVLGYVIAWFVLDEGEVANIAVAPAARGLGIGGCLLDATLAEARGREVAHLFLEVRESNTVARRLYASRGFIELGRRKRYYRHPVEDALVLRCVVNATPAPPANHDARG